MVHAGHAVLLAQPVGGVHIDHVAEVEAAAVQGAELRQELGHRRVLFATDSTMEGCVGKVLSAELTAEQREDIFWRNFQRLLDRRTA